MVHLHLSKWAEPKKSAWNPLYICMPVQQHNRPTHCPDARSYMLRVCFPTRCIDMLAPQKKTEYEYILPIQ